MAELSIRFTSDEKDANSAIKASLFCPQTGVSTNPIPFAPPLDDAALAELHWYLELFASWPMQADYVRAERIEAQLEDWGRVLLQSVTPDRESGQIWGQFANDGTPGRLLTIDATDPRVLRLPWELLADEGGHIFAQGIGVRRRMQKITAHPHQPFELPVRVLIVVARPDDAGFVDPRAETIPLLDALERLGAKAAVECLYPPTLKTLTDRLRAKNLPPVHVVHFDGHGVYDTSMGLGYLLFENDQHQSDRVDANRLGTLLNRCGVPLMVLNACQSAKQEETNPYASVAARLIRAGVGSVLAMNYSVLVVAAQKFVEAFYGGLADGLTVGKAVDEGRYALLADLARHTITRRNQAGELVEATVTLHDWFLPALYQQAADPVVFDASQPDTPGDSLRSLRPGSGQATTGVSVDAKPRLSSETLGVWPQALTNPAAPGGLPAQPKHGFHGRAHEMLQLERAFAEHAVVMLHGFGGIGKTTLAAEAGRWFYRTGRFPGGAAFVSFEAGGSLQQLCSWIGQAVSGDPNFTLGAGDPVERVAQLLYERPALVILDNFESVLGRNPLLPPAELQVILDAVWSWATGKPTPTPSQEGKPTPGPSQEGNALTPNPSPRGRGESEFPSWEGPGVGSRVLITTRDTNVQDTRFSPSRQCAQIELGGLAQSDALRLAAAVLADYGIDRAAIRRQELVDLMERLGGHPLSLYLALPHLKEHTPAELSAQFENLLPGFISGAARERNESLMVSLEFSLRRLGAETRAALPALAVFEGGAFEDDLLAITGIDAELWHTARVELEQAALVSVEALPNIKAPFLRFHPTLLPYLATQLPAEQRAALEEHYRERYYQVSTYLYHTDTQHPHEARAMALREMLNLKRAFALTVAAAMEPLTPTLSPEGRGSAELPSPSGRGAGGEVAATAVDFAGKIASFLDYFGRWRERDALLAQVANLQVTSAAGVTETEYRLLDQRGDVLLQQGRAAAAEQIFRELLNRLEAGAAYDAAYDHAMTLFSLGRCLAAQGRPAQALDWHRQALQEFGRLSEASDSAKKMFAACHVELADNLTNTGHFDEAQKHYETALPILKEVNDQRSVGVTLGQLGTLAMTRGDLPEAARRHTEALQTFRALGEPQMEAVAWHQLGRVAQEAKEWDEAERCYRESLKLKESFHDLPGVARTCNQLALVAKGAGRLDDAERWYLRAIELGEQLGDRQGLGKRLNNLANLYLTQNRLAEAEQYARRAVEIDEAIGDPSVEIWKDYNILAGIAEKRGRTAEAAQWRRKANESQEAFAGTQHHVTRILQQFQGVIAAVAAACEGNDEAKANVEGLFETFREGNWQIVEAIQRIWKGERDADALTAAIDYNSRAIVLAILARLAGAAPSAPAGAAAPPAAEEETQDDEGGVSLTDFLALIVQACRPDAPAGLAAHLHAATRAMSADPNSPPELRALAAVLNQILSGARQPDLASLPPELQALVQGLLGEL